MHQLWRSAKSTLFGSMLYWPGWPEEVEEAPPEEVEFWALAKPVRAVAATKRVE